MESDVEYISLGVSFDDGHRAIAGQLSIAGCIRRGRGVGKARRSVLTLYRVTGCAMGIVVKLGWINALCWNERWKKSGGTKGVGGRRRRLEIDVHAERKVCGLLRAAQGYAAVSDRVSRTS